MTTNEFDFDGALDSMLDLAPDERAAFIASVEQKQPEVAVRLRRLIAFALGDTDLPQQVGDYVPALLGELLNQPDLDRVGTQLGPFKITSLIKRGGMGVVFQAQRNDGAYEQTVAIKFLPRLAKSAQRRKLFLDERANLARLEHPNIARIIDAGLTDDVPYFVMEYVDGEFITHHCASLPVIRMLEVFRQVCDAIIHCHQSFVVHGDIKPANILVADDRVRLLDFGVGKWLSDEREFGAADAVGYSEGYAAPELLAGGSHTIASDVFSLGVLLQALFTHQGTILPPDLRLVVERCTAKEPAERYQSAESLKADIDAYVNGFPIRARRSQTLYVVRKFIERNRVAVLGASAVVVSLVAGLIVSLWQYREAKSEAHRATETATFVKSLFDRINPEQAGSEDVTLRQILDETAIRIEKEMQSSPEVRAEIMELIASGYSGLGDNEASLSLRENVLAYHQKTKTPPHIRLAEATGAIGQNFAADGDYERARAFMQEAIAQYEAIGKADTLEFADLLGRYVLMMTNHTGGPEEVRTAIALLERKGEILRDRAPDDRYLEYIHLSHLASAYDELGDNAKAVELKKSAIQIADDNNYTLQTTAITTLCNLGYSYDGLGQYEDAIATHKKCIERRIERLGQDHPELISAHQNLAAALIALGRFEEAQPILQESVEVATAALADTSFVRLAAEINLARLEVLTGDAETALSSLQDLFTRMNSVVGEESAAAARVQSILGKAYIDIGDVVKGTEHLRDAYSVLEDSPYWSIAGNHWASDVTVWRAAAELAAGNVDLATLLAQQGATMRRAERNAQAWRVEEAERVLANTKR